MRAKTSAKNTKNTRKKPTRPRDDDRFFVSRAELAQILGLSGQRIRDLIAAGLPETADHRIDLRAAVPWRVDQVARSRRAASAGSPRDRVLRAQHDQIRLHIAIRRHELVPVDLVRMVLDRVASAIASQLDGLGPRLAGELATLDDPAAIQALLFSETRRTRSAIADAVVEIADFDPTDFAADPATEPEEDYADA